MSETTKDSEMENSVPASLPVRDIVTSWNGTLRGTVTVPAYLVLTAAQLRAMAREAKKRSVSGKDPVVISNIKLHVFNGERVQISSTDLSNPANMR